MNTILWEPQADVKMPLMTWEKSLLSPSPQSASLKKKPSIYFTELWGILLRAGKMADKGDGWGDASISPSFPPSTPETCLCHRKGIHLMFEEARRQKTLLCVSRQKQVLSNMSALFFLQPGGRSTRHWSDPAVEISLERRSALLPHMRSRLHGKMTKAMVTGDNLAVSSKTHLLMFQK